MTDLNKKIEQLERDCGKDWELAFDNFLLADLKDVGQVQELFTETDLYLFWLSIAYEVNECLNVTIDTNNRDNALRLIRLKRIVDGNLLKLKDEVEVMKDLEFELSNLPSNLIELNCEEDKKNSLLHNLYTLLVKDGFISRDKETEFNSRFIGGQSLNKINWLGSQKELLSFAKFLGNKKIIIVVGTTITKILIEHFEVTGKPLKKGSVGATLPNVEDWEKEHPEYLELIG